MQQPENGEGRIKRAHIIRQFGAAVAPVWRWLASNAAGAGLRLPVSAGVCRGGGSDFLAAAGVCLGSALCVWAHGVCCTGRGDWPPRSRCCALALTSVLVSADRGNKARPAWRLPVSAGMAGCVGGQSRGFAEMSAVPRGALRASDGRALWRCRQPLRNAASLLANVGVSAALPVLWGRLRRWCAGRGRLCPQRGVHRIGCCFALRWQCVSHSGSIAGRCRWIGRIARAARSCPGLRAGHGRVCAIASLCLMYGLGTAGTGMTPCTACLGVAVYRPTLVADENPAGFVDFAVVGFCAVVAAERSATCSALAPDRGVAAGGPAAAGDGVGLA